MEEKTMEEWVKEGDSYHENRTYLLAIECYDKALEMELSEIGKDTVWYKKGAVYFDVGNYYEAIKCFDEAREINPDLESAKKARKIAVNLLSKSYAKDLKNSAIYKFIGILVILGAVISLIFFIISLNSVFIAWGSLISAVIYLLVGVAWIGLTQRFRILSNYLEVNGKIE